MVMAMAIATVETPLQLIAGYEVPGAVVVMVVVVVVFIVNFLSIHHKFIK